MPYSQSWLDTEAAMGGRVALKGTPDEIRAMVKGLGQVLASQLPPPSEKVKRVDGEVEGIKYRLYWPVGAEGQLPTAVYAHGGGWMTGDLDSGDHLCSTVCEHSDCAVVSIDYRLTPEHRWPSQLDDCMTVYRWALQNASTFHADPTRFFTIGDSAGGALALQMAPRILCSKGPSLISSFKGIVAINPVTTHFAHVPEKYRPMYTSYTEHATNTPIADKETMEIFFRELAVDPKDPEVFTILAGEDVHGKFPPTYLVSCECDPMRDDAIIMERALNEAGVPTRHDHYKGLPHIFWMFPSVQPEGRDFMINLTKGVEWLKAQM